MGRPTDNPKNNSVKFLADDETFEKLKECSEKLEVSRAEVIRNGSPTKDTRHFPSRLLPESKSDVNIIPCVGFSFKQYRNFIERTECEWEKF